MDQRYRKINRTAVFTAVLCILLVIGIYVVPVVLSLMSAKPPDVRKIERVFSRNQEEFWIVTEFLERYDAQSIIIVEPDGTMQADFAEQRIEDQEVLRALECLFSLRKCMSIYKSYDTVQFRWWSHWIVDIGSYVAYSENQARGPNVQYATEIMPLKTDGWYYVISDYNKWRVEN